MYFIDKMRPGRSRADEPESVVDTNLRCRQSRWIRRTSGNDSKGNTVCMRCYSWCFAID
jgi:hypothetical protein